MIRNKIVILTWKKYLNFILYVCFLGKMSQIIFSY